MGMVEKVTPLSKDALENFVLECNAQDQSYLQSGLKSAMQVTVTKTQNEDQSTMSGIVMFIVWTSRMTAQQERASVADSTPTQQGMPSRLPVPKHRRYKGGIPGATREFSAYEHVYYIGIIDMLKPFTWYERYFERDFKVFCLCMDKKGISVARPHKYRRRFLAALEEDYFETPSEVEAVLQAEGSLKSREDRRNAKREARSRWLN